MPSRFLGESSISLRDATHSRSVMSAERRRAHVRVGVATVGVFLLFLLVGAAHQGANASSGAQKGTTSEQSTPVPPSQSQPYGGQGGFDRGRGGGGRFRGGPPGGFGGGPPD